MRINLHSFYCINCGNKAMELPRKEGHQYGRFHRKKLYCPYCKLEINCIECKNDEDIYEFKENFEKGVYENERTESLDFVRNARHGQEHFC